MSIVTSLELEPQRVAAAAGFRWELTLLEQHGRCCLQWRSSAPFRPLQGRLCIYARAFPEDPATRIRACSRDDVRNGRYLTELPWGPEWCAAWIARSAANGPYVYLARTALTGRDLHVNV